MTILLLADAVHYVAMLAIAGLLIVVGVALDTLQQIESHLVMRHYDGFMAKGRLRARRT
mgnify:CR=1 FL=1